MNSDQMACGTPMQAFVFLLTALRSAIRTKRSVRGNGTSLSSASHNTSSAYFPWVSYPQLAVAKLHRQEVIFHRNLELLSLAVRDDKISAVRDRFQEAARLDPGKETEILSNSAEQLSMRAIRLKEKGEFGLAAFAFELAAELAPERQMRREYEKSAQRAHFEGKGFVRSHWPLFPITEIKCFFSKVRCSHREIASISRSTFSIPMAPSRCARSPSCPSRRSSPTSISVRHSATCCRLVLPEIPQHVDVPKMTVVNSGSSVLEDAKRRLEKSCTECAGVRFEPRETCRPNRIC
eukprot:SAG11_NODE_770_length_7257_cov_2.448449_8_plen_293_part_00